jgi:hypothetical protein
LEMEVTRQLRELGERQDDVENPNVE